MDLQAFSPPEIDRKDIGSCPEYPLFTVNSCHEDLPHPVGRIGDGIAIRTIGSDRLINESKGQPPKNTNGKILGPTLAVQFTRDKLLLFFLELCLVDPH